MHKIELKNKTICIRPQCEMTNWWKMYPCTGQPPNSLATKKYYNLYQWYKTIWDKVK